MSWYEEDATKKKKKKMIRGRTDIYIPFVTFYQSDNNIL